MQVFKTNQKVEVTEGRAVNSLSSLRRSGGPDTRPEPFEGREMFSLVDIPLMLMLYVIVGTIAPVQAGVFNDESFTGTIERPAVKGTALGLDGLHVNKEENNFSGVEQRLARPVHTRKVARSNRAHATNIDTCEDCKLSMKSRRDSKTGASLWSKQERGAMLPQGVRPEAGLDECSTTNYKKGELFFHGLGAGASKYGKTRDITTSEYPVPEKGWRNQEAFRLNGWNPFKARHILVMKNLGSRGDGFPLIRVSQPSNRAETPVDRSPRMQPTAIGVVSCARFPRHYNHGRSSCGATWVMMTG